MSDDSMRPDADEPPGGRPDAPPGEPTVEPLGQARGELLSAYLDGEVGAEDEARVRVLLERSPDARRELDELSRVRAMLRGLPPVEPPEAGIAGGGSSDRDLSDTGAIERGGDRSEPAEPPAPHAVRLSEARWRARRPRRAVAPRVAAAMAVAAATVVVFVGIVPLADPVVPPVQAYAARHQAMAGMTPVGPLPDPFTAVSSSVLEQSGMPVTLDDGFQRVAGYEGADGTLHVVYQRGDSMVSVYGQPGEVMWNELPGSGARMQLDDDPAWAMAAGGDEVMVVEKGSMVYTVVGSMPAPAMATMAGELPSTAPPSLTDRAQQAARAIVERFGFRS